jgi:hypothetical protein
MRYFCYNEWDENRKWVETISEDKIRRQEWGNWYYKMCQKFGKEHVDENYSFQDCLDEWIIVNQAWESTDE